MSLRSVGSKGGIILRVVSLEKLCTVVGTRSWTRTRGESVSGANWKGGTEVVPDFEYDHSLRPPHAKIARTPLVFTQRHRLANRFMNRSETDGKKKGERGRWTPGWTRERETSRGRAEGPAESSRSPRGRNRLVVVEVAGSGGGGDAGGGGSGDGDRGGGAEIENVQRKKDGKRVCGQGERRREKGEKGELAFLVRRPAPPPAA